MMRRTAISFDCRIPLGELGQIGANKEQKEYDGFNRLTNAIGNGYKAEYEYRPDDMRLSKTVNGQKTTHIWDGVSIVLDLDNAGAVKNKYIRGHGLIAFDDINNTRSYYLKNAHGDITQLANQSGTITKNYTYDAFGVETNPDLADKNPFRYAGEYYDQETKSIYLRARYYSPSLGRFGSEDTHWNQGNMVYGDEPSDNPMPDVTAIRQSSNLYVYAMNNPLFWIDPSGFKIELSGDATDEQKQEYERAIAYLKTSEDGNALVEKLESSEEVFTITFVEGIDNDRYDPDTKTIQWDVQSGLVMNDGASVMSAALALAHEMGHGAQHLDGGMDAYFNNQTRYEHLKVEEANVNKYETPIAKQLGEPTRSSYEKATGGYRTNNSIHFITTRWQWQDFRFHKIHHNRYPILGTSISPTK